MRALPETPRPSRAKPTRGAGGGQPARVREHLMEEKITDSLILLFSILLVGIPTVMMLPDRAVTWPDLARTILWATAIYALRQLTVAVIALIRSRRAAKKPRPRLA